MSVDKRPVRMVRACSPGLDCGRLHATMRLVQGAEVSSMKGRHVCPAHDDPLSNERHGACLDNFWSEDYLRSLSWREAFRLWRSWRRGARS